MPGIAYRGITPCSEGRQSKSAFDDAQRKLRYVTRAAVNNVAAISETKSGGKHRDVARQELAFLNFERQGAAVNSGRYNRAIYSARCKARLALYVGILTRF